MMENTLKLWYFYPLLVAIHKQNVLSRFYVEHLLWTKHKIALSGHMDLNSWFPAAGSDPETGAHLGGGA